MTDLEMQNPSPRTALWVKFLLGFSLALNLAVAGMVLGAFIRHDGLRDHGRGMPALRAFGAPYMLALPREERRAVIAGLRGRAGSDIPDRAGRRAMYGDVLEALRRSPFDVAALQTAVARQASTTIAVQQAAQQAWLDVIAGMTDAERHAYASQVEEVLRRGHGADRRH